MRRAFSAIELAVVLIIITILVLMLLPTLQRGEEMAVKTKCLSRVHQVGMAFEMYQMGHNGQWPWARHSVHPEHPDWPDPTGSLAGLYPEYAPKAYLFQCPATADVVRFDDDNRDFYNCADFYVSPSGRALRPEDEGKQAPCPPSYFYDAGGGLRKGGIPRNALPSRVVYGDECVHGYWVNGKGQGLWLGKNNHPLDAGNFLFADKHAEWLDVRWSGTRRTERSRPSVPNMRVQIRPTDAQAGPYTVFPDSNVFTDDWAGARPESDAHLSGMMWVGDGWMEN